MRVEHFEHKAFYHYLFAINALFVLHAKKHYLCFLQTFSIFIIFCRVLSTFGYVVSLTLFDKYDTLGSKTSNCFDTLHEYFIYLTN